MVRRPTRFEWCDANVSLRGWITRATLRSEVTRPARTMAREVGIREHLQEQWITPQRARMPAPTQATEGEDLSSLGSWGLVVLVSL